jgi:hypothetical protein
MLILVSGITQTATNPHFKAADCREERLKAHLNFTARRISKQRLSDSFFNDVPTTALKGR